MHTRPYHNDHKEGKTPTPRCCLEGGWRRGFIAGRGGVTVVDSLNGL